MQQQSFDTKDWVEDHCCWCCYSFIHCFCVSAALAVAVVAAVGMRKMKKNLNGFNLDFVLICIIKV